ncbi:hypothetical protein FACS189426_23810 [Bacteroidia bacterium]|nr:hypothetical protein FACS189426_23810 [Bacteroidia bacterium]
MDKLSEFIPLILIIVWVVSSIKGSKKKKTVTYETTLPGKTPGKIKPVVTNTRETQRDLHPEAVYVNQPKKQPVTKYESLKQKEKILPKEEIILPEVEADYGESFFNISDADELKRAIVYAEIFNRKE